MSVQYLNPEGVGAPVGLYSNLSIAGDLLFVAGQFGLKDGELPGPGMAEQVPQCFANIGALLESQGLEFEDVVQFMTFVLGDTGISDFYTARATLFGSALFPSGAYPPNTLLQVAGLAMPGCVVEIQAVARLRSVERLH